MPRLTKWGVRLALANLAVGVTLGSLILCSKATPSCPGPWMLLPLHTELLLLGWMAQLAVAAAYWILPRFAGGLRGREPAAWAALALLNSGVWIAGAAPALAAADVSRGWIMAGRTLEVLAAVAFAIHTWPRVKRFGV